MTSAEEDYWGDDDYESPEEYEAAQFAAEDPPDWYLEQEAERHAQIHRDTEHGGGECDCPPWRPPRCRVLYRLPRWSPRHGWRCGTPGGCGTVGYLNPVAAWRDHRICHESPF